MAALFLNDAWRKRIDRLAWLQRARWRLEAGLLHLFWQVCARLEPPTASAFGQRLLETIGPRLGKTAHIERNLSLAFPDRTEAERRDLMHAIWGSAGAVLGEYPHLEAICREFDGRVETVARIDIEDYRSGARQGIFVTAHVGNWELSASAGRVPLTVMYAPGRNPFIERLLQRQRAALGCGLASLDEGVRPLLRAIGEGRSIGLVVDARDDSGSPLPFFGMDKLTTLAPARLALRFGRDLIPVRVERLGHARFRQTIYEPIRPDPGLVSEKDQAMHMMREVNRLFEQWIRERPQQWLCIKRAWPVTFEPPAGRSETVAAGAGAAG